MKILIYHISVPLESKIAWPEGNMLTYLDGNVNLDVLQGAVSDPVKLSINECHNGYNCDFLLKMITIEPPMLFDGPVNVSLQYDREHVNGKKSFEDTSNDSFSIPEGLCV